MRHTSTQVLAHGVGGRSDLPIPAGYAYAAAAAALAVSFAVLALAWRNSRFTGDAAGRSMPVLVTVVVESRSARALLVLLALAFAAWVSMAALFGTASLVNPTFGTVYALLWVGLVPAALLFGPIYRLCNPLRWLHRGLCALARINPSTGVVPYPDRLGMWPAAALLLAFVWLELVDPAIATDLTSVTLWFAAVGALLLLGAAVYGDTWFARADPFELYSSLVARLSPYGRTNEGTLVVRNPLDNLDGVAPLPGLVGVVSVLLGSTAFDSFRESSRWLRFSQRYPDDTGWLNTLALVGFCLVVLVTFTGASALVAGVGHVQRRNLPDLFAHSVVPIVVGYVVAHYLSFFVSTGIATLQQLGDPLSRGWDLTPWAYRLDKYAIYEHPTAIAVTNVLAIVAGHVLGVVAAHDRAVRLLPHRRALVGQLPLLVLMVAYTLTGLWLLFSS